MHLKQHHFPQGKVPLGRFKSFHRLLTPVLAGVHLEKARAGKGVKETRVARAARLLQQRLALAGRGAGGRVEVGQQAPDAGGRARRARRAPERVRGRPVQRCSLAALAACAQPSLSRRVTHTQQGAHSLLCRASSEGSALTWHMMSDVQENLLLT